MIPPEIDSQNTALMYEVKAISKLASGETHRFVFRPVGQSDLGEFLVIMAILDTLQAAEIIEPIDPLHPGYRSGAIVLRRR